MQRFFAFTFLIWQVHAAVLRVHAHRAAPRGRVPLPRRGRLETHGRGGQGMALLLWWYGETHGRGGHGMALLSWWYGETHGRGGKGMALLSWWYGETHGRGGKGMALLLWWYGGPTAP